MKRTLCYLLTFATLLVPSLVAALDFIGGSIDSEYNTKVYYETVRGDIIGSGLDVNLRTHDNWHYDNTLDLSLEFMLSEYLVADFGFKISHTTDKASYSNKVYERFKPDNISLSINGKHFGGAVGDIEVDVSDRLLGVRTNSFADPYTYKYSPYFGFMGWFQPIPSITLILLGGRNRDPASDTYKNAFGFTRLQYEPNSNAGFGISYLHNEITKLYYPDPTVKDYSNDVVSFDAGLNILDQRLLFKTVFALSLYDKDRRKSNSDTIVDYASHLEIKYLIIRDILDLEAIYEYIRPSFKTTLGGDSSPRDQERLFGKLTYMPSPSSCLSVQYSYIRNFRTNEEPPFFETYTHEVTSELKLPLLPRRNLLFLNNPNMTLSFTYIRKNSNDAPQTTNEETTKASIGISDKYNNLTLTFTYSWELTDCLLPNTEDTMKNGILAICTWKKDFPLVSLDASLKYTIDLTNTFMKNPDYTVSDVNQYIESRLSIIYTPLETKLTVNSTIRLNNVGEGDDSRKKIIVVTLSQPLFFIDIFNSSIELQYENCDYWSLVDEKRFSYERYTLNFNVAF